jgi:hypothetical protein
MQLACSFSQLSHHSRAAVHAHVPEGFVCSFFCKQVSVCGV